MGSNEINLLEWEEGWLDPDMPMYGYGEEDEDESI